MKRASRLLTLLMIVSLVVTATGFAVTYPFPAREPARFANGEALQVGTKMCLFHSGTEEVRSAIGVNDVLTVYHGSPYNLCPEAKPVGKVKVLSPQGAYYFTGEVIEGEVRPGDMAMKSGVACFVTPFTGTSR